MKKIISIILAFFCFVSEKSFADNSETASDVVKNEKEIAPDSKAHAGKKELLVNLLLARELLLEKYASNKEKGLSEEEKAALLKDAHRIKKEAWEKLLAKFDKDGDGKLSAEERKSMREHMKKHRFERDEGVNRVLPPLPPPPHAGRPNPKDEETAGQTRGQQGKGKLPFKIRPSVFILLQTLIMERYDVNGDGRLDADEYAKLQKDAEFFYMGKIKGLVARYDTNGDGKLDEEERKNILKGNAGADVRNEPSGIGLDDIDRFIQNSFEEELIELLEDAD